MTVYEAYKQGKKTAPDTLYRELLVAIDNPLQNAEEKLLIVKTLLRDAFRGNAEYRNSFDVGVGD